ncbi:MAG TPA: GIY-YIG nuclease family protein, partial [Thermoanaerobaculia bacterium]|nr:GIY-YIG nuclease family protein [Thermoanaerobaculia bacterium]
MSDHEHLAQRIRELPDKPGIYIFKDAGGKVLYVGKAKSLRKRVTSYLSRDHEPRLAVMMAEAV